MIAFIAAAWFLYSDSYSGVWIEQVQLTHTTCMKTCGKNKQRYNCIEWRNHEARRVKEYILITLATIPYAIGIALFLDPNDLAPGGLTGISILVNRLTGIDTGSLFFILNIPILLLGMWKFGGKFILSTLYALALITFFTNVLQQYEPITHDRLMAAVAGSCLVALGMGVVLRCHATTGGMDIIVKLLRRRYPYIRTGSLFFMLDTFVVMFAGLVFRDPEAMVYAAISTTITTTALDKVLYGHDGARLIYIISGKEEAITESLLYSLQAGVTVLHGEGAYTQQKKKILMCVVDKKRAVKIEEIVKETDRDAFLIITSANEIYGEGYKNLFQEKI